MLKSFRAREDEKKMSFNGEEFPKKQVKLPSLGKEKNILDRLKSRYRQENHHS